MLVSITLTQEKEKFLKEIQLKIYKTEFPFEMILILRDIFLTNVNFIGLFPENNLIYLFNNHKVTFSKFACGKPVL